MRDTTGRQEATCQSALQLKPAVHLQCASVPATMRIGICHNRHDHVYPHNVRRPQPTGQVLPALPTAHCCFPQLQGMQTYCTLCSRFAAIAAAVSIPGQYLLLLLHGRPTHLKQMVPCMASCVVMNNPVLANSSSRNVPMISSQLERLLLPSGASTSLICHKP